MKNIMDNETVWEGEKEYLLEIFREWQRENICLMFACAWCVLDSVAGMMVALLTEMENLGGGARS